MVIRSGTVVKTLSTGRSLRTPTFILRVNWNRGHYNFDVLEVRHYYSTYYASAIIISHLFEICHYVRLETILGPLSGVQGV
jgi:hypothetical protein